MFPYPRKLVGIVILRKVMVCNPHKVLRLQTIHISPAYLNVIRYYIIAKVRDPTIHDRICLIIRHTGQADMSKDCNMFICPQLKEGGMSKSNIRLAHYHNVVQVSIQLYQDTGCPCKCNPPGTYISHNPNQTKQNGRVILVWAQECNNDGGNK